MAAMPFFFNGVLKMLKMIILTSVCGAQHQNAGRNIYKLNNRETSLNRSCLSGTTVTTVKCHNTGSPKVQSKELPCYKAVTHWYCTKIKCLTYFVVI